VRAGKEGGFREISRTSESRSVWPCRSDAWQAGRTETVGKGSGGEETGGKETGGEGLGGEGTGGEGTLERGTRGKGTGGEVIGGIGIAGEGTGRQETRRETGFFSPTVLCFTHQLAVMVCVATLIMHVQVSAQ
jgi:hypothetical protein